MSTTQTSTRATSPIDFGRRQLVIRRPISLRLDTRTLVVCGVCLLGALVTVWLALSLGTPRYSPGQVWATLTGHGTKGQNLIILHWRLPRALAGVIFGAMLAASGALFQTLTRNPLGSPDIIGFTTGAHTGGLITMLLVSTGFSAVVTGSLVGGLGTALIVVLLARKGTLSGFRLIIVGIALTSMLASIDTWLILTAELDIAMVASTWGAGTLNGTSWKYVTPSLVIGVVLLIAAALLGRRVAQLDLGDDQASALGTRPERTRVLVILVGVALAAAVTAVAGPIAFVALAAPQIGRRLARATGTPLAPAMAVGALVLPLADVIAQHGIGTGVPVGVVTVCLGGGYLLFLIVSQTRRGAL